MKKITCTSAEEVESGYWNQDMVTLHPIVTYYKDEGSDELKHKSFVFVSDELGHNSSTVYTFKKSIITQVKAMKPNTVFIHYLTDSPTSQYRNKYMFYVVANHESI